MNIAGEFEISRTQAAIEGDPTKTTSAIKVVATDTLKDIAAKINAADGIGVSASILTLGPSDERLVLTSRDEGSNGFFVNNVSGNALGATGLGFISDTQSAQSDFAFVLEAGGAAAETSTLRELTTGIGSNNLTAGDAFRVSGTRADGTAVANTDWVFDPDTNTVRDFLDQIESAFGATVSANLNDSGEIVLTDLSGGLTNIDFNIELIDDGSGSSIHTGASEGRNVFNNVLASGTNAFFKLDGLSVSSQSNTAGDLVQGTKINLKKASPGQTVKVSLSHDIGGITNKIKEFIDEYNALLKFIDEKSKVEVKEKKDGESGGATVGSKGPLAGDSTVRRLRAEIQKLFTSQVDELNGITQYSSLARVGITSSKTDGSLEIDNEDLKKALETDFDGVRRLFAASGVSDNPEWELGRYTKDTESGVYAVDADGNLIDGAAAKRLGLTLTSKEGNAKGLSIKVGAGGGTGSFTFVRGLASKMEQYYQRANDFVSGIFKDTREAFKRQIDEYDERIFDMQDRVTTYTARLTKQFADMEQSISRLQSQQQSFAAQISAA